MPTFDSLLASILPARATASLTRRLLKVQGIGAGTRAAAGGEAKALRATLGDARAPVLFDVGANVGEWTRAAKTVSPDATIHAFEPSQVHRTHFTGNTKDLGDVHLSACALSAEAGSATLYKDAEVTGLASLTQRDLSHLGVEMDRTETVALRTLDDYCAEAGVTHIDFLKIDVEGHELDVLIGAQGMLGSGNIGAVQFEFGGCNVDTRTFMRDFHQLFDAHGYALHRIRPNGALSPVGAYREYHEQFATTNLIALPQDRQ